MDSDTPEVAGRYYPAGESRQIEARLRFGTADLRILSPDGRDLRIFSTDQHVIEPRIGTAPRRIVFGDGSLFETSDFGAIDRVGGASALHGWEAFHPGLIAVVLASLAGVFLVWRFALPVLVTIAVWLTPPPLLTAIDRGTMRTLDFTMAEPTALSDFERAHAVKIFETMRFALPDDLATAFAFNLQFRNMPGVGPNAFALPGGTVVLTDAFVDEFPDEDILASVIGHELGHVVEQHGLRQLYRSLGLYFLVAFIAGDTGPILEDVLLEGNVLLSLSHSRAHERDADQFGLRLTREAGYDPSGLLEFFESLPEDIAPDWLSTHPGHAERQEAIREFLEEN